MQRNTPIECGWKGIIILNDRVKLMMEEKIMDEQEGFRAGRNCNDQIFAVRQVVGKTIVKDRSVYMVFVDLDKA